MIQLLVYKGFYCSVKVMKEPPALFLFLPPLQLTESADALHISRSFMACVLPGMDDALDLHLLLSSCVLKQTILKVK